VITDTRANIHRVAEVIKAIDAGAEDETQVRVFQLKHHDPVEVANLLTGLFSDQGNTGGAQSPFQFRGGGPRGDGGGPGAFMAAQIAAATAGANAGGQADRLKKRQRVIAVADARTSSVVVTATRNLMDQIGIMVEQLDHESPKVSKVSVIHLNNADPQQVNQVLQDMFQSTTARNRNSSTQTSPFQTRIQQNQNNTTTGTGIGTFGSGNTRGGTGFPN
jgi:type II secretory pathway component GspD/PulD (secretin)